MPVATSSRLVDLAGDSVGRAGGGLHAPTEIVGVGACEVDPAVRLDHGGPELAQFARSVIHRLAGTGPDVARPVDNERLLDIVCFSRIESAKDLECLLGGSPSLRGSHQ